MRDTTEQDGGFEQAHSKEKDEVSIFDAAIMGDMNAVMGYLKTGTVNDRDKWGESMLHKAALNDQIHLAKELIKRGADVNMANACQKTPLQYSCLGGSKFVALLLVENGADVHAVDSCKQSAMHSACIYGHLDTAQILRAHGADVSVVDEHNMTPLHYSSANGHTDVVRFLVAAGARLEAKDNEGRTPLHTACIWGELEVIQVLVISGADTDSTDNVGRKPLQELDVHSLKDLKVMEENALRASAYNNSCYEADHFQPTGLSTGADRTQEKEQALSAHTVQLAAIESGLEKAQLFNHRLQQQQQIQGCVLQREMLERQRNEKALTATFLRVQRLENILKRSAAFMYEDVVGQQERAIMQLQDAAKSANARLMAEQSEMMAKMEDEQRLQNDIINKLQSDAVDVAVTTKLNSEQLAIMSKLLSDKDVILAAQKRALEEMVEEQAMNKAQKREKDVEMAEKRMDERDALINKQQQDIQKLIDDADAVRQMAKEAAIAAQQEAADDSARQQKQYVEALRYSTSSTNTTHTPPVCDDNNFNSKTATFIGTTATPLQESDDRCKVAEDKAALHQERYEKLQGLVQQLLDDAQAKRGQQQQMQAAIESSGGLNMDELRQAAVEAQKAVKDAQELAELHKKRFEQQDADIKRLQDAVLAAQQSRDAMEKAAREADDLTAFHAKRYEEQQADIQRLREAVQATQVKNAEDTDSSAKSSIELAELQKQQILQQKLQFDEKLAHVEEARMKSIKLADERAEMRYDEERRTAQAQQECIKDQRMMLDMLLAEREDWKRQKGQLMQQQQQQQQQEGGEQHVSQVVPTASRVEKTGAPKEAVPVARPAPAMIHEMNPPALVSHHAMSHSHHAVVADSVLVPPAKEKNDEHVMEAERQKQDATMRRKAAERVFDEEKARVEQLTREDAESVVQACVDGQLVSRELVMQVIDKRNTVLAAIGVASSKVNEQREIHDTLVSHFSTRYLCSVLTAAAEAAPDEAVRRSLLELAEQQNSIAQSENRSRHSSRASDEGDGSGGASHGRGGGGGGGGYGKRKREGDSLKTVDERVGHEEVDNDDVTPEMKRSQPSAEPVVKKRPSSEAGLGGDAGMDTTSDGSGGGNS